VNVVASSSPLPEELPLDAASWEQIPLVVRHLVLQLLDLIRQQPTTTQQLETWIKTLEARVADLEARLARSSSTSDRPPASDPPFVRQPVSSTTKGTPGAKPGHPGHRQALLAPTEVIAVRPKACPCGQREFLDTAPYQTHQVIELPAIQMHVTHVILHEARCPRCGPCRKAALPEEPRYGYGPRLTALIGELSGPQRDSRSAVQELCSSVLGIPISRRAVQAMVDRVSKALKPHYEAITQQVRDAKVSYIDETAWYQHGVLAWLWVMVNPSVALFMVHASRSQAAFEALVERWAGILVSDGYGVYRKWLHGRQTCLAHLIRRARGLSERQEPELARSGAGCWRSCSA
jgi:transposase